LNFIAYWLKKKEHDSFDYLGSMLGTNWTEDRVKALFTSGSDEDRPAEFLLPLSYLLAPNIKEIVKPSKTKTVGDVEVDDDNIRPITELSKEEFLNRYRTNKW
jgi:hypothetical protein